MLEQTYNYSNDFYLAVHSVDFYQLKRYYLHPDYRNSRIASHLLYFFKKDVESAANNYNNMEWINENKELVKDFQKQVLKLKHPVITDDNMDNILSKSPYYLQNNYNLSDNLHEFR